MGCSWPWAATQQVRTGLLWRSGGGVTMDMGAQRIMVAARPRVAAFVTCPWCVSPYLAVVVVACQALAPKVWIYPAAVLAFSAVAGLFSELTP